MDRPIRGDNEDVGVDSQVFPVSAANVQANGSGRNLLEESLDNWPRLAIPSASSAGGDG